MELFARGMQMQPRPMLVDVIRLYSLTYGVSISMASRMVRRDALDFAKSRPLTKEGG